MSEPTGGSGHPEPSVHRPVLLRETLHWLNLKPGQTIVDGTVGAGGHSREILKKISPHGTLIGLDRDPMMIEFASRTISGSHCFLRQASYAELPTVLKELNLPAVDAVLLDLGLSSDQLLDEKRGFGFQTGGKLDLRFDPSTGKPAWKLLEKWDCQHIESILREFGEEPFARKIAETVVERRFKHPIQTADELVEAVSQAIPSRFLKTARKHPATRVFQALRIAVNDELGHLERALNEGVWEALPVGGRAVVISFHSLEDRIVKQAFRNEKRWQNLTPKPITAKAVEKRINPRCRTAKVRAAIKN